MDAAQVKQVMPPWLLNRSRKRQTPPAALTATQLVFNTAFIDTVQAGAFKNAGASELRCAPQDDGLSDTASGGAVADAGEPDVSSAGPGGGREDTCATPALGSSASASAAAAPTALLAAAAVADTRVAARETTIGPSNVSHARPAAAAPTAAAPLTAAAPPHRPPVDVVGVFAPVLGSRALAKQLVDALAAVVQRGGLPTAVRALRADLTRNTELLDAVKAGRVSMAALVLMTPQERATKERAQQDARIAEYGTKAACAVAPEPISLAVAYRATEAAGFALLASRAEAAQPQQQQLAPAASHNTTVYTSPSLLGRRASPEASPEDAASELEESPAPAIANKRARREHPHHAPAPEPAAERTLFISNLPVGAQSNSVLLVRKSVDATLKGEEFGPVEEVFLMGQRGSAKLVMRTVELARKVMARGLTMLHQQLRVSQWEERRGFCTRAPARRDTAAPMVTAPAPPPMQQQLFAATTTVAQLAAAAPPPMQHLFAATTTIAQLAAASPTRQTWVPMPQPPAAAPAVVAPQAPLPPSTPLMTVLAVGGLSVVLPGTNNGRCTINLLQQPGLPPLTLPPQLRVNGKAYPSELATHLRALRVAPRVFDVQPSAAADQTKLETYVRSYVAAKQGRVGVLKEGLGGDTMYLVHAGAVEVLEALAVPPPRHLLAVIVKHV